MLMEINLKHLEKKKKKEKRNKFYSRPMLTKKKLDLSVDVKKICGGDTHTLLLSDNGDVFAWGSNKYGQLGTNDPIGNHYEALPKKIPYFKDNKIDIVDIASGPTHSFALSDKGLLYAWGFNDSSRCGLKEGDEPEVKMPTLVEWPQSFKDKKIIGISCGSSHNIVVLQKE